MAVGTGRTQALGVNGGDLLREGFAKHQAGRIEQACIDYRRAVAIEPGLGDGLYLLGVGVHGAQPGAAGLLMTRALAVDPRRTDFGFAVAKILVDRGDYSNAVRMARRVLALDPGQLELRGLLAAIGSILYARSEGRADPAFLGRTYDDMGPRLTPNPYAKRLRTWVEPLLPALRRQGVRRLLDIGCGTGPIGDEFHASFADLTGCDMSERSLQIAASKGRYRRLVKADILEFLRAEPAGSYEMVTAAGSFCYFGDLSELLRLCRGVLIDGGLIAFTIFRSDLSEPERDPGREVFGIFKHSQAYVEKASAAANLLVAAVGKDLKIFDEGKRDIVDDLYVLKKPPA
jgi:predicted TPR repeat methyltransferase